MTYQRKNAWVLDKGPEVIGRVAEQLRVHPIGRQYLDYCRDSDFAVWLYVADRLIRSRFGLSLLDLPDWAWRDAYDADQRPRDAVVDFIEQGAWQ
jgi:hypothetical protein